MAFAFKEGPVSTWVPSRDGGIPGFLWGNPLAAWNVSFEAAIIENVLKLAIPHDQYIDTMAEAAIAGLPLGLDLAAQAAGLPVGKDKEGHALMMRMSRPRTNTKGHPPTWWHLEEPAKLDRLINYCKLDVQVERAISNMVPRMSDTERKIWQIDFDMNKRGVMLDHDLVDQMQTVVDEAQTTLRHQMQKLTHSTVSSPSQTAKLLEWINCQVAKPLPDLRRETLENYKTDNVFASKAIKIRMSFAKASTAKLKAMKNCVGDDGAMRGLVQYYGAMRTGRFAGRIVQPQNMPRPVIKQVENATAHLKAGMTMKSVRTFYGDPMEVVSSCLRGAFVARQDHLLFSIDFSQIEARVLAWLAGQKNIVKAFADGVDVYTLTANEVGSHDRFLGKVLVLACGYQMGGPKFHETATKFGLEITENDAKIAVALWRQSNDQITAYWSDMQQELAVYAGNSDDMPVVLRSDRVLPYRNVHFIGDGDIAYVGLNTFTHKWGDVKIYGGKLVENIVQATARDVMTDAMIRVNEYLPHAHLVMTVHDELVYEVHKDNFVFGDPAQTLNCLEEIISEVPTWASGLPIAVEGWHGTRYRK